MKVFQLSSCCQKSEITAYYCVIYWHLATVKKLTVSYKVRFFFNVLQRRLGDAAKKAISKLQVRTIKKGDKVNVPHTLQYL